MGQWDRETARQWDNETGPVDTVGYSYSGTVIQWDSDTVGPWGSGAVRPCQWGEGYEKCKIKRGKCGKRNMKDKKKLESKKVKYLRCAVNICVLLEGEGGGRISQWKRRGRGRVFNRNS